MSRKINYLLIIFSIYLSQINLFPQGRWESIPSPTNHFLRSVHFTDSLYGWSVGDSGTIIHTTNSGMDWSFQDSKTENKIVDVFFLNRNLGWALSWNITSVPFGTVILKTTDGGENWNGEPYRDENLFMQTILYLDSLNGWMGGKPHAFVRTSNGGINWEQVEIDTAVFAFFPVASIKFFNDQIGFASGGAFEAAGVMWRTTNGGDLWFVIDALEAPPDPIHEFHIIDSLNIIGVGGDFELFGVGITRSSDGGLSWQTENLGILGVAIDIEFRSNNEAWVSLGGGRNFLYSLDVGSTWIQIPTPDSTTIIDLIFPDSLHGFAVGKEGAILKYKPPIVNTIIKYNEVIPASFELFQNYPNPFNPKTIIKYSIPQLSNVVIKIFDILGNEVATLVNEEKPASVYEVEFNAEGLASGVYLYRLNAGEYQATKKMILLR
jgi:photosystem II stability/assembly factor-like uncharacterized protein